MKILLVVSALLVGAYGGVLTPARLREGKIIGGTLATIQDAPYQVALLQNYNGGFYQVCGGSIISRVVVLTAAHCTDKTVASQWRIRAGSSFHSYGGQVIPVAEIIQHIGYTKSLDNDIALMMLSSPLLLGPTVAVINLPDQGQSVADGTHALITGWGYLKEGVAASPLQLYKVVLPILNQTVCAQAYKNFNPVTSNMICAGTLAGLQDACQGDSGGPLVVNDIQFGITSWGRGCARPNSPGVYTRVASYRLWMNMGRHLNDNENNSESWPNLPIYDEE